MWVKSYGKVWFKKNRLFYKIFLIEVLIAYYWFVREMSSEFFILAILGCSPFIYLNTQFEEILYDRAFIPNRQLH